MALAERAQNPSRCRTGELGPGESPSFTRWSPYNNYHDDGFTQTELWFPEEPASGSDVTPKKTRALMFRFLVALCVCETFPFSHGTLTEWGYVMTRFRDGSITCFCVELASDERKGGTEGPMMPGERRV